MLVMQRCVTLRKVGHSIFFTIPADIVRAYRLGPGDSVFLDAEEDKATLRFFRVTRTETPALMNQEEAVEGA